MSILTSQQLWIAHKRLLSHLMAIYFLHNCKTNTYCNEIKCVIHCFRKTRLAQDAALDLLGFRREIVQTYLRCYSQPRPSTGRLRGSILSPGRRVSKDVRNDHRDHYQKPFTTQRRCGVCHKNTRKGCHKCAVGLHDHCFEQWHGYMWLCIIHSHNVLRFFKITYTADIKLDSDSQTEISF